MSIIHTGSSDIFGSSLPAIMQSVLDLEANGHNPKRRKALQACQNCRKSKKGCIVATKSRQCQRCEQEKKLCSFASDLSVNLQESTYETPLVPSTFQDSRQTNPPVSNETSALNPLTAADTWFLSPESENELSNAQDTSRSAETSQDLDNSDEPAATSSTELRYATMLQILQDKSGESRENAKNAGVKLISGTNPLSALLQRELKHKIVTNSCSFRTPDPIISISRQLQRSGIGVHGYDWDAHYQGYGIPAARMQYLRSMGCFELPCVDECSHLLGLYFTHVHPLLPVLDRKEFLAAYYGSASPPSLLVLRAIFLAGTRYSERNSKASLERRLLCDELHSKLRALIEVGLPTDRLCVVQATIIASVHWEGREGVNSAIDNLGLAIRICQEMGLHRRMSTEQAPNVQSQSLLRRIWWVAYAMDRFNAAQEGTPFLVNETDCDAQPLSSEDLEDEDPLTSKVTLLNISLAFLIEEAVRKLYSPGEDHTTLFTPRGVMIRQHMVSSLETFAQDVVQTLIPGRRIQDALPNIEQDSSVLWCAILLTHVDAVCILVHRPFLLYTDSRELASHNSRNICRNHAAGITNRLQVMESRNVLRFSWPFTVYALVNSLLIFWYDVSLPRSTDAATRKQSQQKYSEVVVLLKSLGSTWWAAAAKHRLAQALAFAAGVLQSREDKSPAQEQTPPQIAPGRADGQGYIQGGPQCMSQYSLDALTEEALFSLDDNVGMGFWETLGLDFEQDVAGGIYGII